MSFLYRWYGEEDYKRLCEYAEEWVQCGWCMVARGLL